MATHHNKVMGLFSSFPRADWHWRVLASTLIVVVATACSDEHAPPLAGTSQNKSAVVTYLADNAQPLDGFQVGAPYADLAPLDTMVDGRTVVMLGEPDHGIVESRLARLRLIAYLYYQHGFTTLADELGRGQAEVVQAYLDSGQESDLERLDINDYPSFARVDETMDFYRGLRMLIVDRPAGLPPLQYRGFDLDHGARNAKEQVLDYLELAASESLEAALTPLVSCLEVSASCDADQAEGLKQFEAAKAELVAASSEQQYVLVQDLFRGLGELIHFYLLSVDQDASAPAYREDVMMRRMDVYLAEANGGVIVSGHNMHISQDLEATSGWQWRSLGEHLADELGASQVFGLGLFYFQGSHLTRNDSWEFFAAEVAPAPLGSLEQQLNSAGLARFLLDLSTAVAADPGSGWLHQAVGTVVNGNSIVSVVPVRHWDGLVFIDAVTPTTPY